MKSEREVHERIADMAEQLDFLRKDEKNDSEFSIKRYLMIAKVEGILEDLRWVVDDPLTP